jgi:DNA-binding beta-propeller fold protein YncE
MGIVALDNGLMYMTDKINQRVYKLRYGSEIIRTWGGDKSFGTPCGIALGRNGRLYVADRENNRIIVIHDDDVE